MVHRLEQIHYLIGKIRKDKHISQQVLGSGICSIQQISKIEKGDVSPDFFLTEILLQRLGMSPDKFEIVLSLEEYEEIETRDDIIDDLRQSRLEAAEKRLETFCGDAGGNQPIRQMNRLRLLGALALERGEYEAAEKNLEEAVRLTMGQVEQIVLKERLLAGLELETLILYAQALRMREKASQAGELLEQVLSYVKKWITDSEERARFQSKIAVVLGSIYREAGESAACEALCEEALELLRDNDLVQCMPSLLRLLAEVYEQAGRQEKAGTMNRWRETLEQLYAHFGLNVSAVDKLYFNACVSQYYLIGEIIREERKARGLSQEELIEGIYQEPATLSRVENGQMPDRKKLYQLMERLGMSGWRYAGTVATEDYHVLEMNAEIEKLLSRHEEEKAIGAAERMKGYVDISIPENRQRVEGLEVAWQFRTGKMEPEEVYSKADELLRLTYREETERVPFRNELRLINNMCVLLWRMGRKVEAISEYKKVLEHFEKSRVQTKYHFLSEGLILDNMTHYMVHTDYMSEAEEWSEKNVRQQLLNGKINIIHYAFSNLIGVEKDRTEKRAGGRVDFTSGEADILYNRARKKCLQYVEWTIDITDIFKQHFIKKLFIKFAKENFGANLEKD